VEKVEGRKSSEIYEIENKVGKNENSQVYELVKEWTPIMFSNKLRKTLSDYLEPEQTNRVLAKIKYFDNK